MSVGQAATGMGKAGRAGAAMAGRSWGAWVRWTRWALLLGGGVNTARQVGALGLIALGTLVMARGRASRVMGPLVQGQVMRAGIRLVPLVCFLGVAMGAVIVGQTTWMLEQVGQEAALGPLLATVVVRELGPLTAALVVLARVGTATVAELGMARAGGEVEALEVLGIDPVHYLVVPRVVGFSASVVCLAAYLVLVSLGAGYVVAFVRGLDMRPMEFAGMVAGALSWVDFPLLGLKTAGFGALTSLIICYHGLARPLRLEEVGEATTRTVAHTLVACLVLDALFMPVYMIL